MADIYKIGVEIALLGNLGPALEAMGQKVLGLNSHFGKMNKEIKAANELLKGFGAIALGTGVIVGFKELVDHGKDLVRLQHNMQTAGASVAEVADATAKSWEATSRYMSVSVTQAMEFGDNFRGIFGSQSDANGFIGEAAGLSAFMQAIKGSGPGKEASDGIMKQVEAAVKSGEISSNITPALMQNHLEHLAALQVGFGDSINLTSYLAAQRQAGMSYRAMNDDMKYGVFPALVQEYGAGAGQQMMTTFAKIGAGTGWRGYAIDEGIAAGLIDPKYVKFEKGHATKLKSQLAINNNSMAMENQFEYATKIVGPAVEALAKSRLSAALLKDPGATVQGLELGILGKLFPDRNAAKNMANLMFGDAKFTKDMGVSLDAYHGIKTEGGFDGYLSKSLDYQEQAFGTQWQNLLTSLGSPLVGDAAKGLNVFNKAINSMANTFKAHPDAVKGFSEIAAALGAFGIALGTFKVGKGLAGLMSGAGLGASALALDRSAVMLSEAAIALGAKGLGGGVGGLGVGGAGGIVSGLLRGAGPIGLAIAAGAATLFGWNAAADYFEPAKDPARPHGGRGAGGRLPWWNAPAGGDQFGPFMPSGPQGGRGAHNQPVTVAPTVHADQKIYIDGKQVANAVWPIIMAKVSALIPHPTGAPMFSGSNFPYSADSSMGNR